MIMEKYVFKIGKSFISKGRQEKRYTITKIESDHIIVECIHGSMYKVPFDRIKDIVKIWVD